MRAAKLFTALIAAFFIAALAIVAAPVTADARYSGGNGYAEGMTIEAVSRHGNGSQLGVVRSARYGWEVRLPRGTWVACRRSCEETLRVETVDLFETQDALTGYGSAAHECGVFGCLELRYAR